MNDPAFEIRHIDFSGEYIDRDEVSERIRHYAQNIVGRRRLAGYLFAGIDALPVIESGTFGDRRDTYACTAEEWQNAIHEDPVEYALDCTGIERDQPGLVIARREAFNRDDPHTGNRYYSWLKDEIPSMDVAVRALVVIHWEGVGMGESHDNWWED